MSETINVSSTESLSSSEDEKHGPPPAKRRKRNASISFKEKIENILDNLADAAPGNFAVSGKLNAPIITVAIKVDII